ncbi:hypothetical protein K438DRAFT_2029516 [Mycena galopus ATCC 62051]|nr:hypothetical protein K438DRAFT_2029516 [Mycena galopus ATCC 62051]
MSSPETEVPPRPLSPASRAASEAVIFKIGLPLKQCYPEDWNFVFQRAYRQKYGPSADLEAWRDENFDIGIVSYTGNLRTCNMEIAMTSKRLLDREGFLVGIAIEEFTYNDFEAKWAAMELDEKKGLVLDGLVRGAFKAREEAASIVRKCASSASPAMGNTLKAIIAHDPSTTLRLKSIYLFSHPAVEREYQWITKESAPDDLRAFAHLRMLQRNYFIVQALIGILEAYAGKPAPKISVKEELSLAGRLPVEGGQQQICYSCSVESSEKFPVTLKRCSGCKIVWYCSKACQNRDWAEHKKLCGSSSTKFDPALVTATPDTLTPAEFIGCPAPEAGTLTNINFTARLTFFVARRRAMASAHGLLRADRRPNPGQLEREYRVTLAPGVTHTEVRYAAQRAKLAGRQAEEDAQWNKGSMADVVSGWEKDDASVVGSDCGSDEVRESDLEDDESDTVSGGEEK